MVERRPVEGPWILDTDVCVEWLRRRRGIAERLRGLSPADLAVTVVTVAELRFGALRSRDPVANLEQVEAIVGSGIAVLAFDREAARHHAEIRQAVRAQPIGERDSIIAAIARAQGYAVATGNRSEFGRVPDLPVDDWLAA